jgi:rubrerythrin
MATLGVTSPFLVPAASAASAGTYHTHHTHHFAIARLFSGTAQVELREHFAEFAVLYGLVGTNAHNLQDAITGETNEHATIYPGFAAQAQAVGCTAVANAFTEIAADEGDHAAAFATALESLTNPRVRVPRPPKVSPVVITATQPACQNTQTEDNLSTAMHGEAFASAKYMAYAAQAART